MTDFWQEKEAERKRVLEACQRAVGERVKPESYGGSVKSRAQIQWEYKAKQSKLSRHRRHYPGW